MRDPDGHLLIPFRTLDAMRHKPVWAVYRIAYDSFVAERQSDVSNVAASKAKADALNATRPNGHYFRIYRLATASRNDIEFNQKALWWK